MHPHSTTATVMVYAADTLFIGSGSSSIINTLSSRLSEVPAGHSLVVTQQPLSPVCSMASIAVRDMAALSRSAQLLPGEPV